LTQTFSVVYPFSSTPFIKAFASRSVLPFFLDYSLI
jgi:hypothetical protein